MSTSTITGVVGAAVGFFVAGGPQGAYYGWVMGSAIGAAIDPQVIPGPKIGDSGQQLAQEGGPLNIVFGTSPPLAGTLVACQPEPDIVTKRESQGKGGPKVETQTAYRTYAICFGEGECDFVQVWKNGTLVYDADDPAMASNNAEFLKVARFYNGSYDQMPSPDLEAVFGVGHVHAFRGRAYMVLAREDVTRMDGAVSQYQVRLRRCYGQVLTSKPYAVQVIEGVGSTGALQRQQYWGLKTEGVSSTGTFVSGALYGGLEQYEVPAEGITSAGEFAGGAMYGGLESYDYGPEGVASTGAFAGGAMYGGLIDYTQGKPEGITSSGAFVSGTLT